jgi:hypothetical protein
MASSETVTERSLSAEYTWKLYEENRVTARSHQSMRAGLMNIVIAITSAIVAFSDKMDQVQQISAGFLLIVLGVFSLLFTRKYYEREKRCLERAKRFYIILNDLVPKSNMVHIRDEVDLQLSAEYGRFYKRSLHAFWYILSGLIVLMGAAIFVFSFVDQKPSAPDRIARSMEAISSSMRDSRIAANPGPPQRDRAARSPR